MSVITKIHARQILDSRGNPTVEADVILKNGVIGRASVPSGASTGSQEAHELRDNADVYGGKGVIKAVRAVIDEIQPELKNMNPADQSDIDKKMRDLDGTPNKERVGANAILAVSLACAKAAAVTTGIPLYRHVAHLADNTSLSLPMPMMNIQNGGAHAGFSTDIQEYMIVPVGASSFAHAMQIGSEIFHALASVLKDRGYATTVGDEGGYAPKVKGGNTEPLELVMKAITKAGYQAGADVMLALDVASSEFYQDGGYHMLSEDKDLSTDDMVHWLKKLSDSYPMVSIEDGCAEQDWKGWQALTALCGDTLQLVGDDLLVTNTTLLKQAIEQKAGNAILIKPNQIGTLSETIEAVNMAQKAGWRTIMSHRSGETEDTTIAHLAIGLNCGQIKTGSLSRTERLAKYNEILRIAESDESLALAHPYGS